MKRNRPKNVIDFNSFLQICSWYFRFIPSFTEISRPLSELPKKNKKWILSQKEQEAFGNLKMLLITLPILKQVTENEPFILKTDASC